MLRGLLGFGAGYVVRRGFVFRTVVAWVGPGLGTARGGRDLHVYAPVDATPPLGGGVLAHRTRRDPRLTWRVVARMRYNCNFLFFNWFYAPGAYWRVLAHIGAYGKFAWSMHGGFLRESRNFLFCTCFYAPRGNWRIVAHRLVNLATSYFSIALEHSFGCLGERVSYPSSGSAGGDGSELGEFA